MAQRQRPSGKISRGRCEGCKLDLGNRLDPYCWTCAKHIEHVYEANRKARLADQMARRAS